MSEMMAGSDARDGAEAAVAPPPSAAAAVVVTVSSPGAGASAGEVAGSAKDGEAVAIDVATKGGGGDWGLENACRICHLSPGRGEEGQELIQLGCGCKAELGTAHRDCAEAWFRLRGNSCCEICGSNAKNIIGKEDGSFMEQWHGGRVRSGGGNANSSERVGCWRGQPFCNFLMACLVIAFILPWFFRINMF